MPRQSIRTLALALLLPGLVACDLFITYTPNTKYADGFDETAFSAVTVGMTKADVLLRVGAPIREFTHENITFVVYSDLGHYTKSSEKAYHQRWLAVDQTGHVVHVFKRMVTADEIPTFPVETFERDSKGVFQPVIREPYARRRR